MKHKMHEVSVSTTEDKEILIVQEDPEGNHHDTIVISPEQVDTLVAWLHKAQKKLLGGNN